MKVNKGNLVLNTGLGAPEFQIKICRFRRKWTLDSEKYYTCFIFVVVFCFPFYETGKISNLLFNLIKEIHHEWFTFTNLQLYM